MIERGKLRSMQTALSVSRTIDKVSRRLARAVTWLTLGMVLVGAFNALARYAGPAVGLSLSSNAYLELQWYLFSLVFLLGAPYTLRSNGHVRVDVLYGSHSVTARAWIDLLGVLLFLLPFCALACWYSWDYAWISFQDREWSSDPGGLTRWPIKAVIPLSFVLLGAQGVSEGVKRVAILRGHTPEEVGLDEPPLEDAA